jgi:hypothetical protein
MKQKQKMENIMKLKHFSLDKIKNTKKKPIKIKNASPKLNILQKYTNIKKEPSFLNKTLNNFGKSNSFIYKDTNLYKKQNNIIYEEILESLEKELKNINANEYINNIIKIIEKYKTEFCYFIEQKRNKNEIKNIVTNNYENIIKYSSNYFFIYKNKCSNFLFSLKNTIQNLIMNPNRDKYLNNNISNNFNASENTDNSRQIINNYTHNNNNNVLEPIHFFPIFY